MSTGLSHVLTCVPQSMCSWNYRVLDASAGSATLTFNFFTEQGGISLGDEEFTVRKHGWLSWQWSLEGDGQVVADAQKPSALFRSFEIGIDEEQITVTAQSVFGRGFDILCGGSVVGSIQPIHPFTRRALIDCSSSVFELAQLFSFWLVVVTWKRAANNNNS